MGATKRGGGAVKVYPHKKGYKTGGGGAMKVYPYEKGDRKSLSHDEGGPKKF